MAKAQSESGQCEDASALAKIGQSCLKPPMVALDEHFDCQSCGACCSYSAEWPRFSTEDDAALDLIPEALVAADLSGMRCDGMRCAALTGDVGKHTACSIHLVRPEVCRTCMPGDVECLTARAAFGL